MANSGMRKGRHFAILPSAGMGHLIPFSRLAIALSGYGCNISFVTAEPTISLSESHHISQLLTSFPNIHALPLPLVHLQNPSADADPFFLRFEALCCSADRLPHVIVNSDISALIIDITLASAFVPIAKQLSLPSYVFFTSSAAMLSLCAYFPTYYAAKTEASLGDIDISGLFTIPRNSVLPFLHSPNNAFTTRFVKNGKILSATDGILINTFQALEPKVLEALNSGHVVPNLAPVIAVGPLLPLLSESDHSVLLPVWLDRQPPLSVVYVSFGSRTTMTPQQMKELGIGLEMSGCRFLWVLKTTIVDRDEEHRELEELLGDGYMERVKERGLVVNGWVEQTKVLSHRAVGGFFSHCGWNSVMEAAMAGVRMLGWPRAGDQRVNGEVVRSSGLGVWMQEWSWEAEGEVVSREAISNKVRELMEDHKLQHSAARLREEAHRAVGVGGTSSKGMEDFINKFKV